MQVLCFFLFCFMALAPHTFSADTLTATQTLATNQTLQSSNAVFILGFFPSSTNPTSYYLGIWYKDLGDRTVVWVANRDNPVIDNNSTGLISLKINSENGNIALVNSSAGNPVWSSTNQTKASNPVLQLLDTGNLVIREEASHASNNYLWQSFDHPTDTLLPDMYMGWNLDKGTEDHLTSWRDTDKDPSTGDCTLKIRPQGLPEGYLRINQTKIYRSGPWNGDRFSGVPEMKHNTNSIVFNFSAQQHGVYYSFHIGNRSIFSRLIVTSSGELQRLTWVPSSQSWNKFWYAPKDECDHYRTCGPYGICDADASPICKCVSGFSPKNQQAWNLRQGSGGCVRNNNLDCRSDKFLTVKVKLPDTTMVYMNRSMNLVECKDLCRRNCSCTAYANIETANGGTGCVMWIGELIDMRQYAAGGQDLYVRLAASDVGSLQRNRDLLMNEVIFPTNRDRENSGESNMDELDLPLFDFNTITMATNNFSEANKLGEGGFGIVYMGRLVEGQEIAVKRLSKNSGQGTEEFKNEVKLIIKLQHRNLVRLFGCCIEMNEKLLVYEYMENKSLDSFLFDKTRNHLLDWKMRFNIICGIARGLLYLHHDSRLRIIHRDLKVSNILLDSEMNPKISDFGLARIFATNQTEANTLRVVGTYGYMSPEYALDGNFSVKSDVFSFGVLVLEIITGKKNRGFYYSNKDMNLLGNAWRHWREGNALELIDESISGSYSACEVLRCIHIGLLCVQELADDRPTMSSVILMLNNETPLVLQPRNPGFCLGKNPPKTDSSSSNQDETWSVNQVTVTLLDAR
ncbi:receptor-like serine/threonine-protein kinase SD1-8 isoform X2 [Lotus japonicus]|uniref:receptor-like serine/threonine-protein kinase SD1-8 isoform X2 n=1 Tax=Lotus japonicus TaxID=34305 RepID=UPI002586172C|nr:receptor-like serine/threonine-protein kinase SD1-8 isoform X2 [Lotus japonicus]